MRKRKHQSSRRTCGRIMRSLRRHPPVMPSSIWAKALHNEALRSSRLGEVTHMERDMPMLWFGDSTYAIKSSFVDGVIVQERVTRDDVFTLADLDRVIETAKRDALKDSADGGLLAP